MNKTPNTPAIDATITGLDSGNPTLTLVFGNGAQLALAASAISTAIATQAMMHGLKQKLVDAAALSRNPDTGRAASIDDKYTAVKEVYDRLLSGEWNKRRDGTGGAVGGLLFRALCRMYDGKKTPDAIKAFLDGKTDAEKAALRKNSKVAAIIEELRAESAKADGVNGDDVLAGLED